MKEFFKRNIVQRKFIAERNFMFNLLSNFYFAFQTSDKLILFFRILLFFFILLLVINSTLYLQKTNYIKKQFKQFKANLDEQINLKQHDFKMKLEDFGTQSNIPLICKVDLLLIQSGLKELLPGISVGSFILFVSFVSFAGFVVFTVLFNIVIGILAFFSLFILIFSALLYIREKKYREIESQLKTFVGLLIDYSYGTDDIVSILVETSRKINAPLNQYLEECCLEINNTRNTELALENLKSKVNHPQFQVIIDNLKLASVYDADYERIMKLNSKTLEINLNLQDRRRAIKKSAQREYIILCIAGFTLFFASTQFIDVEAVVNSFVGKILLTYTLVIFLLGLFSTIKK